MTETQTVKMRGLDYRQWVYRPFWRRAPVGYESFRELHRKSRWPYLIISDWGLGVVGLAGQHLLYLRWKGKWKTWDEEDHLVDDKRFLSSVRSRIRVYPLLGLGLVRQFYPMVDWLDTSALDE